MKFQFYRYQDLRARSARLWIMLPFLMIGMAGTASAQYLGADECQGCHAAQYESWITSGHRFILMNGMQARHRPLPLPGGESWDDISFVVGGHKTRINYLDDQGYLIGEQYNLATGEWSTLHSGGQVPYDCGVCHSTGYDAAGNQDGLPGFTGTFALPGVQCEHCHGEGLAMNEGSTDAAFCGECHNHGPEDTVAAADGYILSEGQYNEFLAGPHAGASRGCVTCHNPHESAKSVTAACSDCHSTQASSYTGSLMDKVGVECIDCHMPPATLSGAPLGPNEGDMRSHIFNINTDADASMFTPDGSQLALSDGEGAVTLDFVCQRCHTGTSLETLAKFADDFHNASETFANVGLNPGLSGTWWGGEARSGEGFLIEFAYAGPTLYFFGSLYAYSPAGELVWLTFEPASGVPDSGTTMDVMVYITQGGGWGDGLDPGAIGRDVFGVGTFTFDSCTGGDVNILPNQAYRDAGYTNLAYDLSRLLTAGVDCPTFENNTE